MDYIYHCRAPRNLRIAETICQLRSGVAALLNLIRGQQPFADRVGRTQTGLEVLQLRGGGNCLERALLRVSGTTLQEPLVGCRKRSPRGFTDDIEIPNQWIGLAAGKDFT